MLPSLVNSLIEIETSAATIEGFADPQAPTVAQFLGIPYAESPTGPLRWAPPKSREHVEHIRALSFPPSCWQVPSITQRESMYNQDVPELISNGPMSEDCLKLSIFAPKLLQEGKARDQMKWPVIVWIHGGGFQTGGADTVFENPKMWVARSQKHIVVKVNYRLNIYGWPNAAGLKHGEQNLGLLDIRLALQWVHSNISAFGGDISRIILWGQSAGAMLADYYNYGFPEDNIVSGVILNSGTVLLPIINQDPKPNYSHFSWVAAGLGYKGGDPVSELEFMRNTRAEEITEFLKKNQYEKNSKKVTDFLPMIDGITIFQDYRKRIAKGRFSQKPALIGTTTDEGLSMTQWDPDNIDEAYLKTADNITFSYFWQPAQQISIYRHAAEATTYRFLYAGDFPNISPRPWQKAYHSSDLPIIHGTIHSSHHGPPTSYQEATSAAFQDAYVAFAEDPTDGLKAMGWSTWEPKQGFVRKFGGASRGGKGDEKGAGVWEDMDVEVVKAYESGIRPAGWGTTEE